MFSHAFDFAFSVNSELADASDVSPAVWRAALGRRAAALSDDDLLEACGRFDTAEVPRDD
mgnify:FL=1